MAGYHVPALLEETVSILDCRPGKWVVDCTLGGCGHAAAILDRILPGGRLIGIDRDPDALNHARECLCGYGDAVLLIQDNFKHLNAILDASGIENVDAILADLGVSRHQLQTADRGFSFQQDGPLDMRMDPRQRRTASDIVNQASARTLAHLFFHYGEERWSRRIAERIVRHRQQEPFDSTLQLAKVVADAVCSTPGKKGKNHPATRVFMALRIAVNEELEGLDRFVEDAADRLRPGGRLCVLSFHSLEDRIVKRTMRRLSKGCACPPDFPKCVCGAKPVVRLLTRKALRPGKEEVFANPMARSTRLRAVERL